MTPVVAFLVSIVATETERVHLVKSILGNMTSEFVVSFDEKAHAWLAEHPSEHALVISYKDTRC